MFFLQNTPGIQHYISMTRYWNLFHTEKKEGKERDIHHLPNLKMARIASESPNLRPKSNISTATEDLFFSLFYFFNFCNSW